MKASPFLQMLLTKKRPDFAPVSPFPEEDPPPAPGPTIPIRSQPIVPKQPLAQEPTVPMEGFGKVPGGNGQPMTGPQPMAATAEPTPTIPLKPQSRVEGAAEIVRKYDQGLHPDPKTGEWVPHKRNKGLQILEGLGNFAASGIGLNLQGLLHPRGTPEQQARRALKDEIGLEDQSIQSQRAATDLEGDKTTIALRGAQMRKILSDLENPDTSEEDKRRLAVAKTILDSHPQGFDPNDPADAVALKKLEEAGIPIPASYGKQPKEGAGFSLNPGEARYDHTGKLIVEREPKPEKQEPDVPDTTAAIGELEAGFRKNEGIARAKAEQLESEIETLIQQKQTADKTYDPNNDSSLSRRGAEAKRQRGIEEDQRKRADDLAGRKVTEGNKVVTGRAKAQSKSRAKPAKDGKYHYTPDQIRAKAEADGVSYDDLLKVLQGNKRVVIDQ